MAFVNGALSVKLLGSEVSLLACSLVTAWAITRAIIVEV